MAAESDNPPKAQAEKPPAAAAHRRGKGVVRSPSAGASGILLVLGFLFSWIYIAKGFFKESYFGTVESGVLAYCILLAALIGSTILASVFRKKFVGIVRRRSAVGIFGLLGSLGLLLFPVAWEYPVHVLSGVLGTVLLAVFAAGFVVVFFSWIVEIRDLMFTRRLNTVVVLMLAAMALVYLASPSNLNNSEYRAVLPVVSLGVSAACYGGYMRWGKRLEEAASWEKYFGGGALRSARRAWLIPLSLLVLTINLLSYVEVFVPGYQVITQESVLSYALPFVLSLLLALVAVQSGRVPFFQNKLFWYVCLGFLAVIFLSFFVSVFVLAIQTNFYFEIMYLFRRLTKIMFFIIFMVIIYQEDLNPIPVFGICYVVPLFVPSLLVNAAQLLLVQFAPNTLALIGELAVGYALLLGFGLILCLVFVCVMFVNGSVAKIVFSPGRGEMDRSENRSDRCNRMGDDFALTQREKEVLLCISLGYSMKKTSEVLFISTSTVHTHTATVYRKLGVHSRQEVIDLIDAAQV